MSDNTPPPKPEDAPTISRLVIDLGPLVVFFTANALAKKFFGEDGIYWGTGAFMLATIIAMIVSRVLHGRITPVLWFTGAMVVIFGGLTLYLRDERFIKIKPTIYNAAMGLLLIGGLLRGHSLIKLLLGQAMPLNEMAWRSLTWRWAWFFLFMAGLNEVIWRNFSNDFWLNFKFADFVITFVFAAANVPFMMKNQLHPPTPTESS